MPREARKVSSTGIYHVVVRGIDRQLMFEEDADYKTYLQFLKVYKGECDIKIYAYCLMSNHVHLIVNVGRLDIGRVFSRINTNYAIWFNNKYQRTGPLQQGRYYSEPIETEEYFLEAIRYVHRNPLKAGLETCVGSGYLWNSYHDYLCMESKIVDTEFLYTYLSPDFFVEFMSKSSDVMCLDIENTRKKLKDPEAYEILLDTCKCSNITEFQRLPIDERNQFLYLLYKKKLSINQLSRLTGLSVGVIKRAIAKETTMHF